jgi:hypothetical protein
VVAARKRRIYVPVDITKAFAAPSLAAEINSNASVETILQEVGNPKVRYGAVWDAETDFENSVVTLRFDAPDMCKKPQPLSES